MKRDIKGILIFSFIIVVTLLLVTYGSWARKGEHIYKKQINDALKSKLYDNALLEINDYKKAYPEKEEEINKIEEKILVEKKKNEILFPFTERETRIKAVFQGRVSLKDTGNFAGEEKGSWIYSYALFEYINLFLIEKNNGVYKIFAGCDKTKIGTGDVRACYMMNLELVSYLLKIDKIGQREISRNLVGDEFEFPDGYRNEFIYNDLYFKVFSGDRELLVEVTKKN